MAHKNIDWESVVFILKQRIKAVKDLLKDEAKKRQGQKYQDFISPRLKSIKATSAKSAEVTWLVIHSILEKLGIAVNINREASLRLAPPIR